MKGGSGAVKSRCVAFYIRLSDADEDVKAGVKDESNSITAQRELLHGFLQKSADYKDAEVLEYFDDGFSGTGFSKRESFQKMLSDAGCGKFECIVVKDFSRSAIIWSLSFLRWESVSFPLMTTMTVRRISE